LKRLMEINPTYCLTIEIVPFRNSDLLVAYGSLIREVRQAARSRMVDSFREKPDNADYLQSPIPSGYCGSNGTSPLERTMKNDSAEVR
jgi:hypothetical protein